MSGIHRKKHLRNAIKCSRQIGKPASFRVVALMAADSKIGELIWEMVSAALWHLYAVNKKPKEKVLYDRRLKPCPIDET